MNKIIGGQNCTLNYFTCSFLGQTERSSAPPTSAWRQQKAVFRYNFLVTFGKTLRPKRR